MAKATKDLRMFRLFSGVCLISIVFNETVICT
jgi:hypothetical protein